YSLGAKLFCQKNAPVPIGKTAKVVDVFNWHHLRAADKLFEFWNQFFEHCSVVAVSVHNHYCAALLCLLQGRGAAVKVCHGYIRFDFIFKQKFSCAVSHYLDRRLVLFDEPERPAVLKAWPSANYNDVLALDLFLQDFWVKRLLFYHSREKLCRFLITLCAVSKLCADPLIVREPLGELHKTKSMGVTINSFCHEHVY